MYVMYYASMLRCWQLVRILVRTNHPCLRVGRHNIYRRRFHFRPQLCTFPFLFLWHPQIAKISAVYSDEAGRDLRNADLNYVDINSVPAKKTSSSCIPCIGTSSLDLHTLFSRH
jgi:hypothetical protein